MWHTPPTQTFFCTYFIDQIGGASKERTNFLWLDFADFRTSIQKMQIKENEERKWKIHFLHSTRNLIKFRLKISVKTRNFDSKALDA